MEPWNTSETAAAVLAANKRYAGRTDVVRLEADASGGLGILNYTMDECRGVVARGDFEGSAAAYEQLATTWTRHPVYAGKVRCQTVAEVVAQLPADFQDRVFAVQFVQIAHDTIEEVEPTRENGFLKGWAIWEVRLFRRRT
jgi:hypothetical protein